MLTSAVDQKAGYPEGARPNQWSLAKGMLALVGQA